MLSARVAIPRRGERSANHLRGRSLPALQFDGLVDGVSLAQPREDQLMRLLGFVPKFTRIVSAVGVGETSQV